MKRCVVIFFRTAIILIGIGAAIFLLWEPHVEGRNAHATLFEIYFKDPFLAYVYIGSLSFFVALYKIFRALGYAQDAISAEETRAVLRTIKYCGITLGGFAAGGEMWIFLSESDDRAGGVFMGFLVMLCAFLITSVASAFKRRIR